MSRFIFLLFFQLLFVKFILAQTNDSSLNRTDSLKQPASAVKSNDSLKKRIPKIKSSDSIPELNTNGVANDSLSPIVMDTAWLAATRNYSNKNFIQQAFEQNKFFNFSRAVNVTSDKVKFKGKEVLFYALIALLLFFALIRYVYPKYIIDLFRVTFRTTLKQRQISEQLVQAPIPSLLLNFFFLMSASLYLGFLLQQYELTKDINFWLMSLYCFAALTFIYLLKFLSLKFSGWLFNISSTTDDYIFIIFIINKIMGIYLLPFLVLLAFTEDGIYDAAFTLSYIGIFILWAYRFILSYSLARKQIRLNPFHFFLYLCAFEIVPLLLIYKAISALI